MRGSAADAGGTHKVHPNPRQETKMRRTGPEPDEERQAIIAILRRYGTPEEVIAAFFEPYQN